MGRIRFTFCEITKVNYEIERIAELNAEAFGMDYDGYVNMLLNLKPKYFLMYLDKEIIGVCKITPMPDDFVKLTNVIIASNYRGKGYGSKMISEIKKYYNKIILNAYTKKNYKFYEKNGFILDKYKNKKEIIDKVYENKSHEVEGLWKMRYENKNKTLINKLGIFSW